jgi:hypothetical protein
MLDLRKKIKNFFHSLTKKKILDVRFYEKKEIFLSFSNKKENIGC